ncbi:MAG: hypothetical protein WAU82_24565 [Candidatus Binatus sp.]|uniref:hypothetical protein n=1 Tax=Candidatus Binatus sp. TaxID=2811406 RepID=UPI003BB20687
MLTKKVLLAAASAMLVTTVTFATSAPPAFADDWVDCDAVMNEVNSGKHAKDIATDLNISTSSVNSCKRQAEAAAKASAKSSKQAQSGNEPPMAAPKSAGSPM